MDTLLYLKSLSFCCTCQKPDEEIVKFMFKVLFTDV